MTKFVIKEVTVIFDLRNPKSMKKREGNKKIGKYARSFKRFLKLRTILISKETSVSPEIHKR
jgi:hypothetical protein